MCGSIVLASSISSATIWCAYAAMDIDAPRIAKECSPAGNNKGVRGNFSQTGATRYSYDALRKKVSGTILTLDTTRPASRALFVSAVAFASARLREQGVEHFADHALACAWELAQPLQLLLNLKGEKKVSGTIYDAAINKGVK